MNPEKLAEYRRLVNQSCSSWPATVVEELLNEIEWLQVGFYNLQSQLILDGHDEGCACVQAASVDCSCGFRK